MLGLTLDTWNNLIAVFASIGAVFALFGGGATYIAYRLQKTEAATEKAEFEAYKLDAGKAIAEANARASEAQLALERFKAPRKLTPEHRQIVIAAVGKYAGQKFSGKVAPSVPDARALWFNLANTLVEAGWVLVSPKGLATGNPPAGIPVSAYEGITLFIPSADMPTLSGPSSALMVALNGVDGKRGRETGLHTEAASDAGNFAQPGVIAIEVGTKPQ